MKIPENIIQTYKNDKITHPTLLEKRKGFLSRNPTYKYKLVTDNDCINMIKEHLNQNILDAFLKLNIGAAKGDFARYVSLYVLGGVYIDIDSDILCNLNKFIVNDKKFIFFYDNNYNIMNNPIICSPKHPIMLKLIQEVTKRIHNNESNIFIATGPTVFTDLIYNIINSKMIYNVTKNIPKHNRKNTFESNKNLSDGLLLKHDNNLFPFFFKGYKPNMLYDNPNVERYKVTYNKPTPCLYVTPSTNQKITEKNIREIKIPKNKPSRPGASFIENCNAKRNYFTEVCNANMEIMQNITLPDIPNKSNYEAVFVEFRKLNHVEFIIRNCIHKLGTRFMHTIVCGKDNYNQIKDICQKIKRTINIINLNVSNADRKYYTNLLLSKDFWNKLHGEKILIYQEDSLIFHKNIEPFLQFDYIGAPWPHHYKNKNIPHQGNGGLSLRSKKHMLQCIDIKKQILTSNYLCKIGKPKDLDTLPEDIIFSTGCMMLKCKLPTIKQAGDFSTENYVNKTSFGGHQFWIHDKQWVERVKKLLNDIN